MQSITIGLVAAAVMMTVIVMVSHFRAWSRAPSGSGILPLHVAVISTAHLMFMGVAAVTVLDRLDQPLNLATISFGIASLLTLVALYIVGALQWRRARSL